MTEPEVSLFIAMNYIKRCETNKNITVSIDGAHIKTKDTVHFDIVAFMRNHGYFKIDAETNRWQGEYQNPNYSQRIIVCSKSGIGDVKITLKDGKTLYIESKKFKNGSGGEYPAMREAIGQLMTGCPDDTNVIPIVAVPYNEKSLTLANTWFKNKRMHNAGIRFLLVRTNGDLEVV